MFRLGLCINRCAKGENKSWSCIQVTATVLCKGLELVSILLPSSQSCLFFFFKGIFGDYIFRKTNHSSINKVPYSRNEPVFSPLIINCIFSHFDMAILSPPRFLAEPLAYLDMKKKSEETRQEE